MMSDKVYMQYENDEGEVIARWWGGEYIELGYLADGEWCALDVFNVWDHARGEAMIPRTLAGLEDYLDKRLAPMDTLENITRYLCEEGNLAVPGGRYGTDTYSCAPVAAAVALIIAEANGDEVDHDNADHVMGLVVNGHDDVASLINEHAGLVGLDPEDFLSDDDLEEEDV
jgi:hypothetical protein